MKILIIGGGIGGLALAIALRKKNFDVEIFERRSEFAEIGSGISLTPNGLNALRDLSPEIENAVIQSGDEADPEYPFPFLNSLGQVKFAHPFGDLKAKYDAPMVAILRSKLHSILLDQLPADVLRTNAQLVDFEQDTSEVTALFKNGTKAQGQALVGADGLYSRVRARLFGDQLPNFLGITSIRGIVKSPDHEYCRNGRGFLSSGPGLQVFSLPIGRNQMYWVATPNANEGTIPKMRPQEAKSWLLNKVKGWHAPFEEMVANTDSSTLVLSDIYDRPPLKQWSVGKVTLLGDAAHPMSPFMGQGANMALEDAVCFPLCLAKAGVNNVQAALKLYERNRLHRTNKMASQSKQIGLMGQWENRLACVVRDSVMSLMMKLMDPSKQNDWLFSYKAGVTFSV